MDEFGFLADRRSFLAGIVAAASLPMPAMAGEGGPALPKVRAFVDRYVAEKKVANMVAAVGDRDRPPHFLSAGTLDLDGGPPAGPDTLYRIYSMTKPVTGCAIMMLVEEGKLKLDTPLADIFPAYAQMRVLEDPENGSATVPAKKPILIRHLVTHSAGLVYASTAPASLARLYETKGIDPGGTSRNPQSQGPTSLIAFAEAAASVPLMFEPGTRWNYSVGLDVAGAVVEKLAGMPFDHFLAQRIFAPLAMADTGFSVAGASLDRFAANYRFTATGLELIETGRNSSFARQPVFPSGGGGLVSSARDYARFMAMLLGEGQVGSTRILGTDTARVMMSNLMEPGVLATTATGPTGYGAGGRSVIVDTPGGESVGTFGWSGAANSIAFVDRRNGAYAVLMTQVMRWWPNPLYEEFGRALYADLSSAAA
jgi:CubicO group peptidase (beta-lactamase class C family)